MYLLIADLDPLLPMRKEVTILLKKKIVRRLALLVSLIMLLTSTIGTTYGFVITKTDSLINTFVPLESIINDLLIGKDVEHPFGADYVIPENISFDFKVDFGAFYANTKLITSNGELTTDENGSVRISVKPGKYFVFQDIEAGTKITVTELQKDGSGFAVKDGAVTMEGIVAEDGRLVFQYVNVYTPVSVKAEKVFVSGTKTLEGRDWQVGDTFSFTLEQKQSDDSWTLLDTKTVTYDALNEDFHTFDFSQAVQALTFDKLGVYEFRMSEVVGTLENVDYDKTVNHFAIEVTDADMDGNLEIHTVTAAQNAQVTQEEDGFKVHVAFNNTFALPPVDPEDITVKIRVEKTVENTGVSSITPAGFEFILENQESKKQKTLKSDEDGNAVFKLPFTKEDIDKVYTYKLWEKKGDVTDVTYDEKVYEISVAISCSEENKLVATVKMDGKKVDKAVAAFKNIYHTQLPEPEGISVVILADKTVKNTGELKKTPEGFQFLLKNEQTGEKQIKSSNADGKATFCLSYAAKDIGKTFVYKLSEIDAGTVGMTYDDRVHEFSVAVTLGQNNQLVATVFVNGQQTQNSSFAFVNTYHANSSVAPPTGDPTNVTFWFLMMVASGAACIVLLILDKKYRVSEEG